MFRLGLPLTLAFAVASGAAVAQGKPAEMQPAAATQLQQRVQTALHSDPYFYDAHVEVSIENGNVVLRGIVLDDVDLRSAIRIAGQAAGDSRVIDDLSIVDLRRR
jgi:osmotically-inducible protein OsmY